MKDIIEFLGIMVKINGKKKFFKKGKVYFRGWGYEEDDFSDSGVDVEIKVKGKTHKLDEYTLNY